VALGGGHVIIADRQRRNRGDVKCQIASKVDETVGARDEIRLAVELDEHADPIPGVDVALNDPFGSLCSSALGGLRLAAGAQDLDRALEVAGRLAERLTARQDTRPGSLAQRLDLLRTHRAHCSASTDDDSSA